MYAVGRKKKKKLSVPEVVVFIPSMRIPVQCNLQRPLRGLIPKDLADRLSCIRNQIVLVAEDTGLAYMRFSTNAELFFSLYFLFGY
jgi:hypothetical protein